MRKPMALIIDEKMIDFALIMCHKELLNISQRCASVVSYTSFNCLISFR